MRAKSIVLLLIAGVCGLVASIAVSQVLENRGSGGGDMAMGELFVAVTDIDIGAKLDAANVKLDKWPKDRIPEGAIRTLEDLKDRYPRVRLYAGEPILAAKLMDTNDRSTSSVKVPEGYRVVSVKVTMDEVVSGLVQPGDRVDVIVFLRRNEKEVPRTGAHTILTDVRVFAVNAETERATNSDGEQTIAKTISLLVKPPQAEAVTLAGELGKLRLSLRRPGDTLETKDDEGTTVEKMLGNPDKVADDPENRQSSGIMDLLRGAPTPTAPVVSAQPILVDSKPAWTMTIITPTGNSQYSWQDPKELPSEGTPEASSLPSPVLPTVDPAFQPTEPADAGLQLRTE